MEMNCLLIMANEVAQMCNRRIYGSGDCAAAHWENVKCSVFRFLVDVLNILERNKSYDFFQSVATET